MRNAPPPRMSICTVRKFWVADRAAPSKNRLSRKLTMASGSRAFIGAGWAIASPATGVTSTGLMKRHTQSPTIAASGA